MDAGVLRRRAARAAAGEGGFTLLEVLIAMVLLSFVILGVQAAITDRLVRDTGEVDKRAVALQLAAERIQTVQMEPVYGMLETRYGGTESPVSGFERYRRITTIQRTNANGVDYKLVTVRVERTGMTPVTRTVAIGAP